jgi:iron complex outermembrane receptor protein
MRHHWLGALLLAGPALAQTPAEPAAAAGDDIIIADRRIAPPLTTRAVDADSLTRLGVARPGDAATALAPLLLARAPGNGAALAGVWRGLGTATPLASRDAAVLPVLDGVALPAGLGADIGLFDAESVTFTPMAGTAFRPAGPLTGLAGTLAVQLAAPDDRLSGFGEFAGGGFGRRLVRGSINLPASKAIAVQLSGHLANDTGWARNLTTGERLNDANQGGLRLAVALQLSGRLRWQLAATGWRQQADNALNFACAPGQPTRCNGRFAATALSARPALQPQPVAGISGAKASLPLGQASDGELYQSKLAWDGPVQLAAHTAWLTSRQSLLADLTDGAATSSGVGAARLWNRGETRQFSQELTGSGQLTDSLQLHAGLLWRDVTQNDDRADARGTAVLADRQLGENSQRFAATAGLAWTYQTLSVDAGLAFDRERRQLTVRDNRAGCAPCLTSPALAMAASQLSPRLNLRWWAGDWQLFGTLARGFAGNGWNRDALRLDDLNALAFARSWQAEAGVSGSVAGVNVTASGFATRTDAAPITASIAQAGAGLALAATTADLAGEGARLQLHASPADGLTLSADGQWQQQRRRDGVAGPVPYAPRWQGNLNARWDVDIPAAGVALAPLATIAWRSAMALDTSGTQAPALVQLDGALQVTTLDGNWLLSLECRNCLDRADVANGVLGRAWLVPPRLWQLRLRRAF